MSSAEHLWKTLPEHVFEGGSGAPTRRESPFAAVLAQERSSVSMRREVAQIPTTPSTTR